MADTGRWWVVELRNVETGVTARLSAEEIETLKHAIQMAEMPGEELPVDPIAAQHLRYKFGPLCQPSSDREE